MNHLRGLNICTCLLACILFLWGCKKEEISKSPVLPLPQVKTISIFQAGRLFKCRGALVIDSNQTILEKGVCYDTLPFPTIKNSKNFSDIDYNTIDYWSPSYFSIKLKGLKDETTYYVRAYATNEWGTAYGEVIKFTTESKSTIVVGDDLGGGKVGYIFKNSDPGYKEGEVHGIIAAPNDLIERAAWGGDDFDYIGAGKVNTENHGGVIGANINAASICDDLVLNGYSDWYLPCKIEFDLVLKNMEAIGNFKEDIYWSSTHPPYSNNPFAEPRYGYSFYLFIKMHGYAFYDWQNSSYKFAIRPIRYF